MTGSTDGREGYTLRYVGMQPVVFYRSMLAARLALLDACKRQLDFAFLLALIDAARPHWLTSEPDTHMGARPGRREHEPPDPPQLTDVASLISAPHGPDAYGVPVAA